MSEIIKMIKLEVIELMTNNSLVEKDASDFISKRVYEQYRHIGHSINECVKISNDIYNAMFKLDVIQKYVDDIEVSEIMINGLSPIIIEKFGKIQVTTDRFDSYQTLENIIQTIVSKVNRRVNASSPIVDVRLEDGSRVNIVLPPIAISGPVVTIRKFNNNKFDLNYLVEIKALNENAANFLKKLINARYNIFISGGTSSGKTTFLNALSEHIPEHERVITIEDSAELNLKGIYNLVSLETKPANLEGDGEVTMEELIKSSLRMRPDRIIVGEVRGKEALEMLNAMNTGHDGSLSTGHGNSAIDMLKRLELMVLRAVDIPMIAVKQLISSSIDIVIHLERNIDGRRCVSEIIEIVDYTDDYNVNTLFKIEDINLVQLSDIKKLDKLKKNGG